MMKLFKAGGILCMMVAMLCMGCISVSAQGQDQSLNPVPKAAAEGTTAQETKELEGAASEIERKFYIEPANLPKDMISKGASYEIERYEIIQTYINYSPEIRVRQLTGRRGTWWTFTLKTPQDEIGLARNEVNFNITQAEYRDLLAKKVGNTVNKTRYQFEENGTRIFVDVYSGNLEGLVVAEVEFASVAEAEAFVPPSWFGRDITSDKRYKNANLAKDGMPSE